MKKSRGFLLMVVMVCGGIWIASTASQSIAGGRLTLSAGLFNGLVNELIPRVLPYLQNVNLPDVSGVEHLYITKVYWDLSNLEEVSVNLTSIDTQFITESNGFTIYLHGLEAYITSDWKVHFRTLWENKAHGTADVTFYDSSAKIGVGFAEKDGHIQYTLQSTEITLNHFKLKLHGGIWAWLADFFKIFIVGAIKGAVRDHFQQIMADVIQNINQGSLLLPTTVPFGVDDLAVNISLLETPQVPVDGYCVLSGQANVFARSNPELPPFPATDPLPLSPITENDIQLYVSGYAMNSLLNTLYELNQLNATVPGLNTNLLAPFIPKLVLKYPSRPLSIAVAPAKAPVLNLTTTHGATVYANASLPFEVLQKDNSTVVPVVLGVEFTFGLNIWINDTDAIHGNVTSFQTDFWVISSSVGTVHIKSLQGTLNKVLESVVVPLVNKLLDIGLPIPAFPYGIVAIDPVLYIRNDFMLISSSFTIKLNQTLSSLPPLLDTLS